MNSQFLKGMCIGDELLVRKETMLTKCLRTFPPYSFDASIDRKSPQYTSDYLRCRLFVKHFADGFQILAVLRANVQLERGFWGKQLGNRLS